MELSEEDTPTLALGPQPCSIEELLELDNDALAERVQSNCEIIIDGAMSEWGSKVETLFQKLEKSVLQWYKEGLSQKIILVFAETPQENATPS